GATLPGGVTIKATAVRGVDSHGMLCSARELGLADDHAGLLLLPADAPVGTDLRRYLELDDRRFTIKLTPNRGDCLSVLGVAREVAAITGAPLRMPSFAAVEPTLQERLPVQVLAPDLCGRFCGRIIRGLNAAAETPAWMKRRLERSGQRPISALVDISNYVMLELGRPSHVFDLAKIEGGLEVRWGRRGESLVLLNGQRVEVDETVGVIADARGVEALAGMMGGKATAVTLQTRDVYLEAAFWWPAAIQGRARRFNFSTEAAYRFERGVDYATTVEHLEYLTRLIVDICGTAQTRIGPVQDHVTSLPQRRPVRMRIDRCRKVLGADIPAHEMAALFERLGLPAQRQDDVFVVTPPSYRFDLEIEEDLIEEVARLWGYERIPAAAPVTRATMRGGAETRRTPHALRHAMVQLGYQELINFSFVEPAWEADFSGNVDPIRVLNPIASQMSVMRSSLLGGLVAALRFNLNRQANRVRIFELGRVFARDASQAEAPLQVAGIAQPLRLAALAYGPVDDEQWGVRPRAVDFYDIKGDLERLLPGGCARFEPATHPAFHPGRCARIHVNRRVIGVIGELHPRWQQKYELPQPAFLFEVEVEPLCELALPRFAPVPKTPTICRDLAFWIDAAVPVQQVLDAVEDLRRVDARLACLRDIRLFDVYRGINSTTERKGAAQSCGGQEKSLAFRCVLQDTEKTLSDTEAEAAIAALVAAIEARFAARLRQ
ncbi:MAG: phenylalanine--tRNA ligase subunit beta, partial [Sutterellaceae bacterium]|nr:phenylalanine--tRNA ligase subunit beta [Burkholderiaceae bacterium]MDW8429050.1 phenylalanine--tRNA ligase subunit beta [Sutterellaceae bacterium]